MTLPALQTPPTTPDALHARLAATGHVVVSEKEYLEVRLAILASVRVYPSPDGGLRCEPRFGALGRTTGFMFNMGMMVAAAGTAYLTNGPGLTTYLVGIAAVLGTLYDVARFVVTEHTITRIHMAWWARGDEGGR